MTGKSCRIVELFGVCGLVTAALVGCGAGPTPRLDPPPVQDPAQASLVEDAPPAADLDTDGLAFAALHDGLVRTDSVRTVAAADGSRVAVAWDTLDGTVKLGPDPAIDVASRAQVGCLTLDDATGELWLATLERATDSPVTELVVHRYDAELQAVGEPWRSEALWPEPGTRCAFVPTGQVDAPFGVVVRAREARAGASLDLYFQRVAADAEAVGFESGTRVPSVVDAVGRPEGGALVVLEHVVDDGDGSRSFAWTLVGVDPDGLETPMASGAPASSPLALAHESRTAVLTWLESGRVVPSDVMERPHATVLTRIVPRQASAELLEDTQPQRTDVYDLVTRERAARPVFVGGRWWAVLSPEAYSMRGKTEPEPYQERLVALDEGPAVVRLMPARVWSVDALGARIVALGEPSSEHPGFSTGLLVSGPLDAMPAASASASP